MMNVCVSFVTLLTLARFHSSTHLTPSSRDQVQNSQLVSVVQIMVTLSLMLGDTLESVILNDEQSRMQMMKNTALKARCIVVFSLVSLCSLNINN